VLVSLGKFDGFWMKWMGFGDFGGLASNKKKYKVNLKQ
jgi:hypothetical protein